MYLLHVFMYKMAYIWRILPKNGVKVKKSETLEPALALGLEVA